MHERGSVSIIVVAGTLMLCLTALGATDLGALLLARARAQAAADAAALAAAVNQAPALAQGEDPETAARDAAARNGAEVVRCECAVGSATAEVEVIVRPSIAFVVPWMGRPAHATSRASVDPDVLSYRP